MENTGKKGDRYITTIQCDSEKRLKSEVTYQAYNKYKK